MTLLKKILSLPFVLINFLNFKYRKVSFDQFPRINGRVVISGKGKLSFGNRVKINSNYTNNPVGLAYRTMFYVAPQASIYIGNNVGISSSLFYAKKSICIEDNVLIGGGCQILDNDFHSINYEDRILNGDNNTKSSSIVIKEGAFIGTSSIILKGVTIGERSIIAAGSVVSKSIPADEIWGGNPAKYIKSIKTKSNII